MNAKKFITYAVCLVALGMSVFVASLPLTYQPKALAQTFPSGGSTTTTSIRASVSSGAGINYNSTTGVISTSSTIPGTTITTTNLTLNGFTDGFLKTTTGVVSSTTALSGLTTVTASGLGTFGNLSTAGTITIGTSFPIILVGS
jgi:hypothetical protein